MLDPPLDCIPVIIALLHYPRLDPPEIPVGGLFSTLSFSRKGLYFLFACEYLGHMGLSPRLCLTHRFPSSLPTHLVLNLGHRFRFAYIFSATIGPSIPSSSSADVAFEPNHFSQDYASLSRCSIVIGTLQLCSDLTRPISYSVFTS